MRKFLNQNKNSSTSETADLEMITESQTNEAKMSSEAEEVKNKSLPTFDTAESEKNDFQKNDDKTRSESEEVMQSESNKTISDMELCVGAGTSLDLGEGTSTANVRENKESEFCKLETNDPGKWSFPINDAYRHDLVQCGPQQNLDLSNEYYPKNENGRHFSNFYYMIKFSNGESQHRRWLVYSTSQDKVYCFSCKLFSGLQTQMILGCNDWKTPKYYS